VTRVGLRTSKSRNEPLYTSNMLNEKLYVLLGSKNASSNSICSVRGTTPGRSRVPSWMIGSHYNKMLCLFDMTKNCIGKLVQIGDTKNVELQWDQAYSVVAKIQCGLHMVNMKGPQRLGM
jgi:hypothetical protein